MSCDVIKEVIRILAAIVALNSILCVVIVLAGHEIPMVCSQLAVSALTALIAVAVVPKAETPKQ